MFGTTFELSDTGHMSSIGGPLEVRYYISYSRISEVNDLEGVGWQAVECGS